MSAEETKAAAATGAAVTTAEGKPEISMEDLIKATGTVERDAGKDMISALIDEVSKGAMTFDKNVTKTINAGIDAIDEAISKQLAAIMHHPEFQKLEGSWRGLH